MKRPKVSVIMSVYNEEQYIAETVESILNQTFSDFEFIIIDDGSEDKTYDVLKTFNDPRMRIVRQQNMGLTKSLNKGIELSKGEYIARADAQDIYVPTRFEKQVNFLDKNKKVAAVSNWVRYVDEEGNLISEKKLPTSSVQIKRKLGFSNSMVHSSVMIRKSALIDIGGYNESLPYAQDYDLWLRLSQKYELANIPEFLCTVRILRKGVSLSKENLQIKCALKALSNGIKRGQYSWIIYFHPSNIRRFFSSITPQSIKAIKRRLIGWNR